VPPIYAIDKHLMACPVCDLFLERPTLLKEGHIMQCPRCSEVLEHPTRLSIKNDFICVVVGLIFYFPAMLLPIIQVSMLGDTERMSLLNCVQTLFQTGNIGVALGFFFTLFCVPLFKMSLLLFVMTRLYYKVSSCYIASSFKLYNAFNAWGMLDILLLSFIVAGIKLNADAELSEGLGLYSLIILLLSSALQTQLLDKRLVWRLIERHGD